MRAITPDRAIRDGRVPDGLSGPWYGVYPAVVTTIADPDALGRVKVALPWIPDSGKGRYEAWARVATLAAGSDAGSYFIPDAGTEVLVAFESGDARSPYVVGALWNGQDRPPTSAAADPQNTRRMLRSRSGVTVTFNDSEDHEQLVLETPGGQRITLTDGPASIEIADSQGNRIRMEPSRISVQASSQVEVTATQVTITASVVNVNAGMAKFSSVVQTDTLIANSVVASSYTPGAGNIW